MSEARDRDLEEMVETWSAVDPVLKEQVIYLLNRDRHSVIEKTKNCSFFDALHLQRRTIDNLQAYDTAIALLTMLGQVSVRPCSCQACRAFDQALADAVADAQWQGP